MKKFNVPDGLKFHVQRELKAKKLTSLVEMYREVMAPENMIKNGDIIPLMIEQVIPSIINTISRRSA